MVIRECRVAASSTSAATLSASPSAGCRAIIASHLFCRSAPKCCARSRDSRISSRRRPSSSPQTTRHDIQRRAPRARRELVFSARSAVSALIVVEVSLLLDLFPAVEPALDFLFKPPLFWIVVLPPFERGRKAWHIGDSVGLAMCVAVAFTVVQFLHQLGWRVPQV